MSFTGLYTSVSGMLNTRISIETTSHNIANTNNPHYVRQSALHQDSYYENLGMGAVHYNQKGHGISISTVRQIRDGFLDKQIRRQLPRMGYLNVKSETLEDVEGVFNEITASGLQNVLDDFWNSWQEIQKDPNTLTNRELVNETGHALVNTVNRISIQLKDIQRNIDRELEGKVLEANKILKEISSLNKDIKLAEAEGPHATYNDKRDTRNALLDRISQLLPVEIYEDHQGSAVVSLNGRSLVDGTYTRELRCSPDHQSIEGHNYIYWGKSNEKLDLGSEGKTEGEIGALIYVRDKSIEKYMNKIDKLVRDIGQEVNKFHRTGYGLDGSTGQDFFVTGEENKEMTAFNIRVNPEISNNLNKIAVSATGAKGDGEIARKIYEIRDMEFKYSEDEEEYLLTDDFYRRIITDIGLERNTALNNLENQVFLVQSIDQKRASISSVSLDEDMADLIKYQYSYMANSRVFNTIDEMIDTVVSRVGIVGR